MIAEALSPNESQLLQLRFPWIFSAVVKRLTYGSAPPSLALARTLPALRDVLT